MNYMWVLFPMAVAWTIVATLHDLENKKIPDKIHIAAAVVGIMFSATISTDFLIQSILYGGFFFLVGFFVSISGGWGGGDGKFLGALGTYFYLTPVLFLLSMLAATFFFKAYFLYTGQDPGDIPREDWLEKGVPFLPAFLLAEFFLAIALIL